MKIKAIITTVAIASTALILAACGKNSSSNSSADDDNTLHLSTSSTLDTLDISKATGYGQTGNVFESFYRLDENGKPIAGLAKSGKASKDGLTWTFKLRKAKWSNGQPITAKDFVYSWQRSLNPKTESSYAYLFGDVKNANAVMTGKMNPNALDIKEPNDSTVVVKLDRPLAYFKVLMAYPLFGPQNKSVAEKYGKRYGTKARYQVYSGPFSVKGWNGTNDTWSFVKNKNYWDKDKVKLDKINYQVVKSSNTGYQLYQQKKLDMTELDSTQVKNLQHQSDFKEYPYSMMQWLEYNYKAKDPTIRTAINNRNIRLAISLSIDRKLLVKKVLGNGSTLPKGFAPTKLAYNPKNKEDFANEQQVKNTVNYDPKLAKQYWQKGLKEIGLKDLITTLLSNNDDPSADPMGQYLQSQWTKVLKGINVKISNIPSKAVQSRIESENFQVFLTGWGGDYNDPMTFLQIPLKNTAYNRGKWDNEQYNTLVNKANNEDANNVNKRWQDLVSAAKIVNREQAFTPIYQQTSAFLLNKRVHGMFIILPVLNGTISLLQLNKNNFYTKIAPIHIIYDRIGAIFLSKTETLKEIDKAQSTNFHDTKEIT